VGRSSLVDPMGGLAAELGTGPAVQVVDLDVGAVDAVRREFPMYRQRRLV